MRKNELCLALGFLAVLGLATGCDPSTPATPTSQTTPPSATSTDDHGHPHPHEDGGGHAHGAGPHGGTVADWGGGKFHVEFTVNHDTKEATIHVLGSDEKTATPIKAADGKLLLTIKEPAFQVDLIAAPMDGETDGKSSRYVGKHDSLGIVQEFSGTINGEADGTPYSGDFKEEPHDHK